MNPGYAQRAELRRRHQDQAADARQRVAVIAHHELVDCGLAQEPAHAVADQDDSLVIRELVADQVGENTRFVLQRHGFGKPQPARRGAVLIKADVELRDVLEQKGGEVAPSGFRTIAAAAEPVNEDDQLAVRDRRLALVDDQRLLGEGSGVGRIGELGGDDTAHAACTLSTCSLAPLRA